MTVYTTLVVTHSIATSTKIAMRLNTVQISDMIEGAQIFMNLLLSYSYHRLTL